MINHDLEHLKRVLVMNISLMACMDIDDPTMWIDNQDTHREEIKVL